MTNSEDGLKRNMGLRALMATGICSMLGASVFIVPFMIQRNVPGIGPNVIPAFLLAAVPAFLSASAYAILGAAMPHAGGSYIYASRGLNPFLGFIASFSQWAGLSIVIGVISYVMIPFFRDAFDAIGLERIAILLDIGSVRTGIAAAALWIFVGINIAGIKAYEKTVIPLMVLMFMLGSVVIVVGFLHDHGDFFAGYSGPLEWQQGFEADARPITVLTAASLLFASFIGFDSVAQAGGDARRPTRNIPLAILGTIGIVTLFYILFTAAVYQTIPWKFIAYEAGLRDVTAPGLMGHIIPPGWTIPIIAGAAIALINDLPAMLLSVSRLMFAWAKDGIFPSQLSNLHSRYGTPHIALIASGIMATIGILGCHFAGDFFLGVDIMVTSMLINFMLMCLTLLTFPVINPDIYRSMTFARSRLLHWVIGIAGTASLLFFLTLHLYKDLTNDAGAWYFRSTPVYLIVMTVGSLVFWIYWRRAKHHGDLFKYLP